MIRIETIKEETKNNKMSWGTAISIEGDSELCTHQLIAIFNAIYEKAPELFEAALAESKYTEDHT